MGGKDGGGGGGGDWHQVYATDPQTGGPMQKPGTAPGTRGGYMTHAEYAQYLADQEAAKPKPVVPEPEPEPEPEPQPEPEPEPEPGPELPPDPLGPPISPGEAIPQQQVNSPFGIGAMMNTGDVLGGSVVKPPQFWMGDVVGGRRGGGRKMQTTQT